MTSPDRFFVSARDEFAGVAGRRTVRRIEIGKATVECRCASEMMAQRILQSFAHLPDSPSAPDLVIEAFDDVTSGATMPDPAWALDQYGPLGVIHDFRSDDVRVVFDVMYSSLNMIHRPSSTAVFWVPDARSLKYSQSAFPFRQILAWWFAERSKHMVHAAAVHLPGVAGAMVLPGQSGRGKSSTALACLIERLGYLGDDSCLLERRDHGAPSYVHPLYSLAKLWATGLERFPELRSSVVNTPSDEDPKHAVDLTRGFSAQLTSVGVPIAAFAVPERIDAVESSVVACSSAYALRALAPTSMLSLADSDGRTLRDLAAIVRGTPSYRLLLGTDRRGVVDAVRSVLS